MLGKRSHELISKTKKDENHEEVIHALKKMIKRIESNKEDIRTILDTPLEPITPALLQREVITETDVANVLKSLDLIVGHLIHEGEVDVNDSSDVEREFSFVVIDPLSITNAELALLRQIDDVAKVTVHNTDDPTEIRVELKYTKVRKLSLLYKQEAEDMESKPKNATKDFDAQPSLSSKLLHRLYNVFHVDDEETYDLNIQTKSSKNNITDVIFSMYVHGPLRAEQIASFAAHEMISSVRIYAGCRANKKLLRIEVATFKVAEVKTLSS